MKRRKIRGAKVNHSPPPSAPPSSSNHSLSHHQSHIPHAMKKLSTDSDQIMTPISDYHRSSNNNSRPPSTYTNSNAPERVNIYGVDFETGPLAPHQTGLTIGNGSLHERDLSDFSPSNGSASALDDRRMRRTRTFIDPTSEIPRLEQWFMMTSHPSRSQIERFTEELNKLEYRRKFPRLEAKNLQFWFKNRRAKQKRLTTGPNPSHLMNGPLSTGPLSSSSSSGHNHSPPPPNSISPVMSSSHHQMPLSQSHHHMGHSLGSSAHALSTSASNLLHHRLSHSLNNHTGGNVVDLSVSSVSNLISSNHHHSHNQTPTQNCTDNNNVKNNNNNNNHFKKENLSRSPSPSEGSDSNVSASPINGPFSISQFESNKLLMPGVNSNTNGSQNFNSSNNAVK